MNRIHFQIYENFSITGNYISNIYFGETSRIVFPDGNGNGVSGKVRYHATNRSTSLVLNVDEFEPNYFFVSISRNGFVVGNINYDGHGTIDLNNQFIISDSGMSMLHRPMGRMLTSEFMNIEIGVSEFTRLDVRVNEGAYIAIGFGALAPIMCRANGNVGIPMLREIVRQEAASRINHRQSAIARELIMRFLQNNELATEAEELFLQVWNYCGLNRFIR